MRTNVNVCKYTLVQICLESMHTYTRVFVIDTNVVFCDTQ